MRRVIATLGTVGLAEWIIEGTQVLFILYQVNIRKCNKQHDNYDLHLFTCATAKVTNYEVITTYADLLII